MMCTDFATYELTLTPLSRGNIAKLTRTLIVPPCLHRFRNTAIDNTPRVSDMQPAMHCAGHLWAGENRYFIIGGKRQRGIRHSPPSISFQYPRALYSHARGVLRGAFGAGGNPELLRCMGPRLRG